MKLNLSFFHKRDKLLEKYNGTWEKVRDSLKKEFDSEPVYNQKCLKGKTKSQNGEIKANFHNSKMSKEDSQYICLSVILINLIFRLGKNYYLQKFLEECKYVVKEKKIPSYVIDNIDISSPSDSDEEIIIKKNSDGKFPFMKKILMR